MGVLGKFRLTSGTVFPHLSFPKNKILSHAACKSDPPVLESWFIKSPGSRDVKWNQYEPAPRYLLFPALCRAQVLFSSTHISPRSISMLFNLLLLFPRAPSTSLGFVCARSWTRGFLWVPSNSGLSMKSLLPSLAFPWLGLALFGVHFP